MRRLELISVHVPKCAGNSLRTLFESAFGKPAIFYDYADRPLNPASPMNMDPIGFVERHISRDCGFLAGKAVVHGHFNIAKYAGIASRLRITFLREPVDRLISNYFYWKRLGRRPHDLQNYVLDNGLSFEQFARLPMMREVYSSIFFRDIDMQTFDLIGFHDSFSEDLGKLRTLLPFPDAMPMEKVNDTEEYRIRRAEILADTRLMAVARSLLRKDIDFYENLRAKRK